MTAANGGSPAREHVGADVIIVVDAGTTVGVSAAMAMRLLRRVNAHKNSKDVGLV
jgi:predicted phosphoribosyltransferase